MTDQPPTDQQLDEIETRAAAMFQHADLGDEDDQREAERLTGTDVPVLADAVRRLRAELVGAQSAHLFTLRQRNNRSNQLTHLRDLALAGDVEALLAAAKDTLAASRDDHTACAVSAAPAAPLSAPQPSGVSESAQSPTGAATGRVGDLPSTEDLASADNPTHLRWGLNDVLWSDDDSVIVMLSGPDLEAYWLELDPERAAVLREDLAGPDGESTTAPRRTLTPNEYDAAWHAVEGSAGEEGADPGTVLHAVLDRLGIEWQDAAQPTAATTPAR